MALKTGAQGTYAPVLGIIVAAVQIEITTAFTVLEGLISPVDGIEPSHPDFYHIEKHVAAKIQDEITALRAAIAAAPII